MSKITDLQKEANLCHLPEPPAELSVQQGSKGSGSAQQATKLAPFAASMVVTRSIEPQRQQVKV
jgi:hypothetical protein